MKLAGLRGGVADVRNGFRRRRVWVALATEDIGDQHRLTTLGPIWLLINYLLFAGTFIFVFHRLESEHPQYPAYVAVGLFVWLFLSEVVTRSVTLFIRERSFIQGTTLPLSVYVFRLMMQTLIRCSYALLGCLAILAFTETNFSSQWFGALGSLLLLVAIAPAVIILLAFLGVYFPDSQHLINNIMRVGMFLTPVLWFHDDTSTIRQVFYYWNPFTYLIEIVRIPLLHGYFPWTYFGACLMLGGCCWILAMMTLGNRRSQVVFAL